MILLSVHGHLYSITRSDSHSHVWALLLRLFFHHNYLRFGSCFYAVLPACIFFPFTPSRVISFMNLLSSLCALPRFIVLQLQGVSCTGDGYGFLLLLIVAGTLGDFYNTLYQSEHCFAPSPYCKSTYSWCFGFHLHISISQSLSIVRQDDHTIVLTASVIETWNMEVSALNLWSPNLAFYQINI